MKRKFLFFPFLLLLVCHAISSCDIGKGDKRNRNLATLVLEKVDNSSVEYLGMSNTQELDGSRFQAVLIYHVTDSAGNRAEHNSRVITNDDCTVLYEWEDLDSKVLEDVRQKVSDKLEKKGIDLNGNLIDALIELKKR